jgi:hypothetical protein
MAGTIVTRAIRCGAGGAEFECEVKDKALHVRRQGLQAQELMSHRC